MPRYNPEFPMRPVLGWFEAELAKDATVNPGTRRLYLASLHAPMQYMTDLYAQDQVMDCYHSVTSTSRATYRKAWKKLQDTLMAMGNPSPPSVPLGVRGRPANDVRYPWPPRECRAVATILAQGPFNSRILSMACWGEIKFGKGSHAVEIPNLLSPRPEILRVVDKDVEEAFGIIYTWIHFRGAPPGSRFLPMRKMGRWEDGPASIIPASPALIRQIAGIKLDRKIKDV